MGLALLENFFYTFFGFYLFSYINTSRIIIRIMYFTFALGTFISSIQWQPPGSKTG